MTSINYMTRITHYWLLWQVAKKTLPFYKDYFGIAYPLPKMDLIAIADFAAGSIINIELRN